MMGKQKEKKKESPSLCCGDIPLHVIWGFIKVTSKARSLIAQLEINLECFFGGGGVGMSIMR